MQPPFLRCFFLVSPPRLARKETTHIHDSLSLFFSGASGQRVKVEPEVLSYPGQTVNLRCAFTDATGVQLTMVSYTISILFKEVLILSVCCQTHIDSKLSLDNEILIKMSVSA